ncbi:hypothetical protein VPH35_038422 [Triticum aestivum]|uniref:Uncharacterized protein n=1 Tax=Aegilops tauschii subsp. strangulata TaxID=200361 RepID=A0A453CBZ2_AEGTS
MLSPTTWLQGARVRRDHQFEDCHCVCRYHGHLRHCVLRQQPPAQGKATGVEPSEMQGKATGVEPSEMLCSSEVAYYVCQFVILWPQCTCVSFFERSTNRDYVIMNFDCDGTTNSIKTPVIHFTVTYLLYNSHGLCSLLRTVVQKCTVLTIFF